MSFFIDQQGNLHSGEMIAGDRLATDEEVTAWYAALAPTYRQKRAQAYPSLGDQLDLLYWDRVNGTNNWQTAIAAIKAQYPKG